MKKLFSTKINLNLLSLAILVVRIVVSGAMLTHGIPKVVNILAGKLTFGDPYGFGQVPSLILVAFAEAFCSMLVIMGLGTRIAVIPLIITMATAVFVVHPPDGFARQELPLLFLMHYIMLLFTGAGKYSIDNLIAGKR